MPRTTMFGSSRQEGRSQPIGAAMILVREHLLPLAAQRFDLASLHFPSLNGSSCAQALTNFYSAPLPVETNVEVKVYLAYVEIWHQAPADRHHRVRAAHLSRIFLNEVPFWKISEAPATKLRKLRL